jgi:hypothetical protein
MEMAIFLKYNKICYDEDDDQDDWKSGHVSTGKVKGLSTGRSFLGSLMDLPLK